MSKIEKAKRYVQDLIRHFHISSTEPDTLNAVSKLLEVIEEQNDKIKQLEERIELLQETDNPYME